MLIKHTLTYFTKKYFERDNTSSKCKKNNNRNWSAGEAVGNIMKTILEFVFPLWPLLHHVLLLLSEHDKVGMFTADTLCLVFVKILSFSLEHQETASGPSLQDLHPPFS